MGITRIEFILFYSVFLFFVVFIVGMGAPSILGSVGDGVVLNLPTVTGNMWVDWTLPFTYFWTLLNISSEISMVFIMIIMPFVIGVILIIAEMIRGN